MQLSVKRYQAIAIDRGANLDAIDRDLNDRVWLQQHLSQAANWTDPGPGGFYDDLGNADRQPHLVASDSTLITFADRRPDQGSRLSWYNAAESLFDQPLRMRYTGLEQKARYKVRVVYGGDMPKVPVRLVAGGGVEIHPYRPKPFPPAPLEFDLPAATTSSGTLTLQWTRPPGLGGNGRGCDVAEVWLIKTSP